MEISIENLDKLNAVLKVSLVKNDYENKVSEILADYRKNANIPGFRKGHVPIGLVRKQYGRAVLVDEVNKLLQEALNNYLVEEKLDVLGNPLPRSKEHLDWEAEKLDFEFELGLMPDIKVPLEKMGPLTSYQIVLDKKDLDKQVENLRTGYGKLVNQTKVLEGVEIWGTFRNEKEKMEQRARLGWAKLTKEARKALLDKKIGDVVHLQSNKIFLDSHDLIHHLNMSHDQAHQLKIPLEFTIEEINTRELAELNQDFFDKIFGKDEIRDEKTMRSKLKEDAESYYRGTADQKLMDDIVEYLVDKVSFELPSGFLRKWIKVAGDKELSEEEAEAEYKRSEKGIRYQLIESKIVEDYKVDLSYPALKSYAEEIVRAELARYGRTEPEQSEIEDIITRILSNRDELKRLNDQLKNKKLMELFKEKLKLKKKEVSYEKFSKEILTN